MEETKFSLANRTFDPKDPDHKKLKKIIVKGSGYRTVAAIVDFALTAFTGMLLWMFFSACVFIPIAKATGYLDVEQFTKDSKVLVDECGASYLFKQNPKWTGEDDKQNNRYITFYVETENKDFQTYEEYQDRIYKYYTKYLTEEGQFDAATKTANKLKYTTYWYNVFILGLDDVKNEYNNEHDRKLLNARDPYIKDNTLWQYDGDNYDKLGIPNASLYEGGVISDNNKLLLKEYYYCKSAKFIDKEVELNGEKLPVSYKGCIYEYSINCHWIFESGDSRVFNLIQTHQANIAKTNSMQVTYPVLASIVLSWIIFYLIIPICVKNGRTLGKMMFKMAVVNKLGYSVTIPQMLLRSLFPLFVIVAFYLVGISSFMFIFYLLLLFVVLISYCLAIFTKQHKSIHDYVAGTIVVDSEASTWFKNAVEEEAYQSELSTVETAEEREARLTKEYQEKYGEFDDVVARQNENNIDAEKEEKLTREYHEKYASKQSDEVSTSDSLEKDNQNIDEKIEK